MFHDPVKKINANRKIGSMDKCPSALIDNGTNLTLGGFPTSGSLNQGNAGSHACFDVKRHGFSQRKIDRYVMTAKLVRESRRHILCSQDRAYLVARLPGLSSYELAHRTKSD
jgi:hypothetical protein